MSGASEAPLFVEPIRGIRTWAVRGDPPRLTGVGRGRGITWRLDGRWTEAQCLFEEHSAPTSECGCGLYANHPFVSRDFVPRGRSPRWLMGIVEARGRVELHGVGFRAEYARPVTLFIPPPHLVPPRVYEALIELTAEAEVELVEVPRPRHAREWCRSRGVGLAPGVVLRLLNGRFPRWLEEEAG